MAAAKLHPVATSLIGSIVTSQPPKDRISPTAPGYDWPPKWPANVAGERAAEVVAAYIVKDAPELLIKNCVDGQLARVHPEKWSVLRAAP